MQRREFFQAAVAAAITVNLSTSIRGVQAADFRATLLALADTLVPDRDTNVWVDSAVSDKLLAEFEKREPAKREEFSRALATLDSAAVDKSVDAFHKLGRDSRTEILRELQDGDNSFASKLAGLRSLVLDTYFRSETGRRFCGYRDTSQFAGYPEYIKLSTRWE